MDYIDNRVENIKIAYIGGGSRGWAWGLMSDLAEAEDISGQVALYDIDYEAAKANEIIGNKYNDAPMSKSKWSYHAEKEIGDALTDADFVVISILPGTFKEMESDVHTPEKYGIWQSVGDTVGPGGIIRALRTLPKEERETIESSLREYYLIPKVTAITNIVEKFGLLTLHVETDRGDALIAIRNQLHGIKLLHNTRVLFRDNNDNRYEIPDLRQLDKHSRQLIDQYL